MLNSRDKMHLNTVIELILVLLMWTVTRPVKLISRSSINEIMYALILKNHEPTYTGSNVTILQVTEIQCNIINTKHI